MPLKGSRMFFFSLSKSLIPIKQNVMCVEKAYGVETIRWQRGCGSRRQKWAGTGQHEKE